LRRRFVHRDHLSYAELALIAHKARTMVPFLRRFKADWATEAYLRRSLRNRKGHLKRKGAGTRTGGEPGSDDGGEGGSDDGGGGGSGDE